MLTTLVSWGSFAVFTNITGPNPANAVSIICAVLFAYITNKLWVFEAKNWAFKAAFPEFIKFIASRAVTGLSEYYGLLFLINAGYSYSLFGKDALLTKIFVSVIIVLLNYVFSKLLVFRKKRK